MENIVCFFFKKKFGRVGKKKKITMPKSVQSEFVETFQTTHDGLGQSSCRSLTYDDDEHGPTIIRMTTTLPFFLLPSYWQTHHFTEDDVKMITEHIPAQLLWLSCLVHGLDVIPSCLKPSLSKIDEIVISYRTQALRMLMDYKPLTANQESKLLPCIFGRQNTNISWLSYPVFELPVDQMHELIQLLCPKLVPFCVTVVPGFFYHNNARYAAICLHNGIVVLRRVTEFQNVLACYKQKPYGINTCPLIVQFENDYFALCEDGIKVRSKNNSST